MKNFWLKTLAINLWLLITLSVNAQRISGRIIDSSGEGIPYASVFVKEQSLGTAANIDGEYSINLPKGNYTLVFQSLGYIAQTHEVVMEEGKIELIVKLEGRVYNLAAVKITSKSEDVAYGVMRKAIAMAPYYQRQINSFEAAAYVKGSAKVNKLSRLAKRQLRKEPVKITEGETYVYESQNTVTFKAPNKYEQKVIAARSTFPTGGEQMSIGFLTTSFYQPTITAFISPLSPNAFSHYNYKYLGSSVENDRFIHRIQFTPKRSNPKLMSGTLNIVGTIYCLHSLEISGSHFPGKFKLIVHFAEVQQNVFVPVSQQMNVDIEALGNKAEASYVTSIKYSKIIADSKEVVLQPSGEKQFKTNTETKATVAKPKTKREVRKQETLDKLLEKEDLTNREMSQLSALLNEQFKDTSKTLEIERTRTVQLDSMAYKRDTINWERIRPVPLQEQELKSFQKRDSVLAKFPDSLRTQGAAFRNRRSLAKVMLSGGYFTSKDKKWWLYSEGISPFDQSYNTVDGYVPGYNFTTGYTVAKWKKTFRGSFQLAYSVGRNEPMANVSIGFGYLPSRRAYISLVGNSGSRDFNATEGIHPFSNSITTLFLRDNPLKLFHERQLGIRNNIDLANGLVLFTGLSVFSRDTLVNSYNYSFFYRNEKEFTPNTPPNPNYETSLKSVELGSRLLLSLSYTPRFYYRMRGEQKIMVRSKYPTFAINIAANHYGDNIGFSPLHMNFLVRQSIDFGVFRQFRYAIRTGTFLGNGQLHFSDFRHFNAQPIWVVLNEREGTFMHLPFYAFSTNKSWVQANLGYSAPFIALKYLPIFSNMIWNEGLFAGFLSTRDLPWHAELGYGITEILGSFKVAGYVGFGSNHKPLYGFRLGYNIGQQGISFP